MSLPEGTRGNYAFELSLLTGNCWHRIQVADFQANAFNVTLDARENYGAGEARAESPALGPSKVAGCRHADLFVSR